jgi:hypothetical protein
VTGITFWSIWRPAPLGFSGSSLAIVAAILSVFPLSQGATARPIRLASNKIAEFGKYDSPVGLGIPWWEFSVSTPDGCRPEKTAPAWETKARPPVLPKPRRLCCLSII